MRKICIFILMLCCICLFVQKSIIVSLQAAESSWKQIGPIGGNIWGLALNPNNKNEIYALSGNRFSQLYKTNNFGKTWDRIAIFNDYCYDLALDPSNPKIIYILGYRGVFKSEDSGSNWDEYRFGNYRYASSGQIAIDPYNSSIIYVSGSYAYNTKPWKYCLAVFKSTDGGKNWAVKKIAPTSENAHAYCIAISPSNSDVVYAGGYYYDDNKWLGKLFKSSDKGENWRNTTGSIEGYPESIVIDSKNPSYVYVGTYRGIYRSSDGGNTWQKNKRYVYATALALDPFDSNILYAGYYSRLYKSVDGGEFWTEYSAGLQGSCNRLLAIPISPTKVFFGSSSGIYKSDNSGVSWRNISSGIKAHDIWTLAVALSSPGIIYATAYRDFIYKSSNSGNSWKMLQVDNWMNKIVVNPNNANDLFGLADSRIYRSKDGGNSWIEFYYNKDIRSFNDLAISRHNINNIFSICTAKRGSKYVMALLKSTDRGKNWTIYYITSSEGYSYEVAIDPLNDDIIYVRGSYLAKGWRQSLFKSINGGKDWINISQEISRYIYSFTIDPLSPNKIYIGTYTGVYRSEDSGSSWTQPTSSFHANSSIKVNPLSTNDIFAAGQSGIYFSNDGGNTWRKFNKGLVITVVNCLDIDAQSEILYAGTDGGSIYRYNLADLYKLTVTTSVGGKTNPSQGKYSYEPGSDAKITAIPDTNYNFSHWSGDASGTNNPMTITMDSDKSIKANFVKHKKLTISTSPGGKTVPTSGSYNYAPETKVSITAIADVNYSFSRWSGDASGTNNPITITMDSDKSIKANFISYRLTISTSSGGTTNPSPGTYNYKPGTQETIMAIPDTNYGFSHWSGDSSGSSNPITIIMDSNKLIAANFIRIYPLMNFSGEKVLNRSFLGIEYINILSWAANPSNKRIAKYRIYLVEGESQSILVELDANTFEYRHQDVEKDKSYTYAIVAIDNEGSKGESAYTTVR